MITYTLPRQRVPTRLVEAVCRRLRRGEVGIVPTETVYGLACLQRDRAARRRIYALKAREPRKPLQALVANLDQAHALGVPDDAALRALAERWWPGPLTLVVDRRKRRPDEEPTAGLRMPAMPFLLRVMQRLGEPLAATSANLAGVDPAISLRTGFRDLVGRPDFIVEAAPGGWSSTGGLASTVVRLHAGEVTMLRPGPITLVELEATLAVARGR